MQRMSMWLAELAGLVTGAAIAPLFGVGSLLRQARFFHPDGVCYGAVVSALAASPQWAPLQERLVGSALVRLSSAWWRGSKEWPDVLGCAIRFGIKEAAAERAAGALQDVLFATIPYPFLTPVAPLFTHAHDFLDNTYWGVAPFAVDGVGLARLELVPQPVAPRPELSRQQKLDVAVARGSAVLVLRGKTLCPEGEWTSLCEIRLQDKLTPDQVDQEALRFSPFRAGRGIHPRGFVQAMRRPVYALSQCARPGRSGSARR